VWQWEDKSIAGYDQSGGEISWRGIRGGSFDDVVATLAAPTNDYGSDPTAVNDVIGFRVVTLSIPEPSTLAILGVGASGFLGYAWRRKGRKATSS
jgi:hypothetical protein